jgi:hypothetical protein
MGRRRLEMGLSLEAMLHVYRLGGRATFEAMVAAAQPGEERGLGVIGAAWMDFVDQLSSRSATGYLNASHEFVRRVEARRGAVLQAVLASADKAELAAVCAEFSLTLAAEYSPVLLVDEHSVGHLDGLLAACPVGSLGGARARGALVLVAGPPDLSRLLGIQRDGAAIWGRAAPPGPSLRAEVEHLERLAEVVVGRGLTGVFGPSDLLIEQIVASNPRLETMLVDEVLGPALRADRSGQLLSTLRAYLETGSVAETAKQEITHPNTVSYRLRRIAQVTGYDARVPRDAAVLVVALAATTAPAS